MSKRTKSVIAVLVALVLTLGALLFRAEMKMHDYAEHVQTSVRLFYFDSHTIQMQIDALDTLQKDTGEWRERHYLFIREEFKRQNAHVLFAMAKSAMNIGSNRDSLNKLSDEYAAALVPVRDFFIFHDSLQDVPPGGIEELQNYYRKLKAVAEKFEQVNVELW